MQPRRTWVPWAERRCAHRAASTLPRPGLRWPRWGSESSLGEEVWSFFSWYLASVEDISAGPIITCLLSVTWFVYLPLGYLGEDR